ncbi:MAG: histidinol dehydrogenase, partial [Acidimicrobiales bacterium]
PGQFSRLTFLTPGAAAGKLPLVLQGTSYHHVRSPGFAAVSSGITADSFRKHTAVARADRQSHLRMSGSIITFTEHEGFPAHGEAVRVRLSD